MVRVEVIAVGRELLIGRTLNTNARWIGRRLALCGTMIKLMTTPDDDLREISDSVAGSLSRKPDFVVVLGGLGPTPDDMTLEGVAKGLGRRLVSNHEALAQIRARYERRGMTGFKLTPSRRKMSMLPEGGRPLLNLEGTAPGVRIEARGAVLFCLPGVPSEMRGIFRRSVEPEIRERVGKLHRRSVTLKAQGVYESSLAPVISRELRRNPGVYIKSHPKGIREGISRLEVDIVATSESEDAAGRAAESTASAMADSVRGLGGKVKRVKGAA